LLTGDRIKTDVGEALTEYTKQYIRSLPPNEMGWPSQGFYGSAAGGTSYATNPGGFVISIDNPKAPGAMRYKYNKGQDGRTTIHMRNKLLTIPARQEFYGHSAGEYANLQFGMFKSGTKFLYIGQGGADRVNFATGKSHSNQRGIGARASMMIAYWLKESVEQDAMPEVIPSPEEYTQKCTEAIEMFMERALRI